MRWFGFALLVALGAGCGSAPEVRPAPRTQVQAPVVAAAAAPAPEPEPAPVPSSVQIKGLTGTLNKDDVHQTMDARQPELEVCIREVRRRDAYVHGNIQFGFAVDAAGQVAELRTLSSDIGHYALEKCIADVVAGTQFPLPDGRATARFEWGMQVLGAYEPSDPMDATKLHKVLAKRWAKLREHCEVRRARARNQVTLYVGRSGNVLNAGVVPGAALDEEQLTCVIEDLRDWRMPKPKRRAKLTFAMR
jgi:hypothetical protein